MLEERIRRALASIIRIDAAIGSGGMGIVYRGWHSELEIPVAVKVLRPEYRDADAVERFRQEAQVMARLSHPNIIPVLDFPPADRVDGYSLFIMRFIEGQSLAERVQEARLSPREAYILGLELLDALTEVHRHGVIHRDVKPGNVVYDSTRGHWVLTDFGIAKVPKGRPSTEPGTAQGTREYMPPNKDEWREATVQNDLYSAAATIYEAYTSEPWNANTSPTSAGWRQIPARQAAALRVGTEPEARDRWKSAQEFLDAFRDPPPPPRWPRRVALGVAALVVAAAVVVAFVASDRRETYWGAVKDLIGLHDRVELGFAWFTTTDPTLADKVADLNGLVKADLNATLDTDPVIRPDCTPHYWLQYCVTGRLDRISPDSLSLTVQIGDERRVERVTVPPTRGVPTLAGEAVVTVLARSGHQQVIEECRLKGAPTTNQFNACEEYQRGKVLFDRGDAWPEASRHFRNAVDLNTELVDALWRLYTTDVWRREDPDSNVIKVIRAHRLDLPPMDGMLFDAQQAPEGATRIARFEGAIRHYPHEAFPKLLYGSELFHRGALSCIPLDSSAAVLRQAVVADSNLIEAYDQLLWVLIRMGNQPAADSVLEKYPTEHRGSLFFALSIARDWRFEPARGRAELAQFEHADTGVQRTLRQTFRWGLSLSIPAAESALGARFSRSQDPSARSDGFEGLGIAELSMGHLEAGLSHIDSADVGDTGTLEAAEWRVIPAALGVFKLSEPERERGRATLRSFARSTGGLGARAAWALAVDAYLAGDAKTAATWDAILASQTAPDTVPRLRGLLAALKAGASGANQEALRLSQPSLDLDEAPQIVDPFWRSVLHLSRSHWAHAVGDAKTVRCELGWSNNADIQGWSRGPAQASEVDWVIGRAVHP